jgi:excisionase family DNA binding protein
MNPSGNNLSQLADIPTVGELLSRPELVKSLPHTAAKVLLTEVAAQQAGLTALQVNLTMRALSQEGGNPHANRLLTMQDVAERLNVPKSFAYELCRTGKLKSMRIGKYIRVAEAAFTEYTVRMSHEKV